MRGLRVAALSFVVVAACAKAEGPQVDHAAQPPHSSTPPAATSKPVQPPAGTAAQIAATLPPFEPGEREECLPAMGDVVVPKERLAPEPGCNTPQASPDCRDHMCRIPAGCFIQGEPRDEPAAAASAAIQVQVTLTRSFWFGQTPLTVGQWQAVGWDLPVHMYRDSAVCFEAECPVAYVNLFDAVQYVNQRSELEGLPVCYKLQGCTGTRGLDLSCEALWSVEDSVYDCQGYRLPTESEWEYAARAGTITATYAGEVHAQPTEVCRHEPSLDDTAWYCCNSDFRTHPVAQKAPNPWGLHDLMGTVGQWTTDVQDGFGYGSGPLVNPMGVRAIGRALIPPADLIPEGRTPPDYKMVGLRGGFHWAWPATILHGNRSGWPSDSVLPGPTGLRIVRTIHESK